MTIASDTAAVRVLEASIAPNAGGLTFIETQFPVSKMSKESYAERKSVFTQTLTGLGKWWGRKPLVLCRATILSLLIPATANPTKDREIFLRLMTMDEEGLLRRKSVNIPAKELYRRLPPADREAYFEPGSDEDVAKLKRGLTKEDKEALQRRVFLSMSYDERLEFCDRPEQIGGPSEDSWKIINGHLETKAKSISDLVAELGKRRLGRIPRVGDSFCGGGSLTFEAARIGCDAYGSDLNPVATLLTWASLNIIGGGEDAASAVQKAQQRIWRAVDQQISAWGIEHREADPKTRRRWRADAYLYCIEATCPECGWRIPLASSWVIADKTNVIARLVPDKKHRRFDFEIVEGVSAKEKKAAAEAGTVRDSQLVCCNCPANTPIKAIRGDGRGTFGDSRSLLRPWENDDVVPQPDDIFGERVYCIRWLDHWIETDDDGKEIEHTDRYYLAPTAADLKREDRVLALLMERFHQWQKKGFIPSRKIEAGQKTNEPIRTRGWTHWHHLFTPRQLLLSGQFAFELEKLNDVTCAVGVLLLVGRLADWNSRLSVWLPSNSSGIGGGKNTFLNQAYNTLFNYSVRPLISTKSLLFPKRIENCRAAKVTICDGRSVEDVCDFWITDPPYADAVNYPELSEFYLAWYEGFIARHFKKWYADSKRILAVRGSDASFTTSMVDCYSRLREMMPDDGLQVVMFTHQNAAVWAGLALILWAAGLRVTAAWCIATETGPAVGEGNYVQGTVLLVLRKQQSEETAFLDEVYNEVEAEVRRQLDSMLALDDKDDPNFGDTDYQLAAYAAALRVLTSKKIEEIDVAYELKKTRERNEKSQVEQIIEKAVQIACDHLVPRGIETHLWKSLTAMERFYLKGLEMESHGEHREGVYQELARGFGIFEYRMLLASTRANETRLKTASEFAAREMNDGFGAALVRHALFAAFKTAQTESTREALVWLRTEVKDYAAHRARLIEILDFLATLRHGSAMPHWHKDADAAKLVAGAMRNREDHV